MHRQSQKYLRLQVQLHVNIIGIQSFAMRIDFGNHVAKSTRAVTTMALSLQMGTLLLLWTALVAILLVCPSLTCSNFFQLLLVLQYLHVPPRPPFPSELTFTTPNTRTAPSLLPTLSSPSELVMSVVVPAYNEESRIKVMLAEAVHHLDKTYFGNSEWEILIVDDGSNDETSQVALDWAAELQDAGAFDDGQVRVCRLEKNRGKGGAVSHVTPSHVLELMRTGDAACSRGVCYFRGCGWG
jgi:Glycosyl transferase family 2